MRDDQEASSFVIQTQTEHATSQSRTFNEVGLSVVVDPVITGSAVSLQHQRLVTVQQGQRAEACMARVPAIGDGPRGMAISREGSRA